MFWHRLRMCLVMLAAGIVMFVVEMAGVTADDVSIVYSLEWDGPETSVVEECSNVGQPCFAYPIDGMIRLTLGAVSARLENLNSQILVPPDVMPAMSPIVWDNLDLLDGEFVSRQLNGDASLVFRPTAGVIIPPYELFVEVTDGRSTLSLTGGVESIAASPLERNVAFAVSGRAIEASTFGSGALPEPSTLALIALAGAALVAVRRHQAAPSQRVQRQKRFRTWLLFATLAIVNCSMPPVINAESIFYDLKWKGPETSFVVESVAESYNYQYPIDGSLEVKLGLDKPSLKNIDSDIYLTPGAPPQPRAISPILWYDLDQLVGEYVSTSPNGDVSMVFRPQETWVLPPYEIFVDLTQSRQTLSLTGGVEQDAASPLEPDVVFFVIGQAINRELATVAPEPNTLALAMLTAAGLITNRRRR